MQLTDHEVSLSMVVLNSRDRQGNLWLPNKHTWINSIVVYSICQKLEANLLVKLHQSIQDA